MKVELVWPSLWRYWRDFLVDLAYCNFVIVFIQILQDVGDKIHLSGHSTRRYYPVARRIGSVGNGAVQKSAIEARAFGCKDYQR